MRPTRRGWTVLVASLLALAMGWAFGGRSLNAVVVPGLLALAATGLTVWRANDPTVTRRVPADGHHGETATASLAVETSPALPATVHDRTGRGLTGAIEGDLLADGRSVAASVTLAERGEQWFGPCTVDLTDPLGLWERSVEVSDRASLLVYPRVRPLGDARGVVERFRGETDEREHFDGVREYTPGDPLRDVNWKASASHPRGLYVTTFAGTGETRTVTLGVAAPVGGVDDAAEAAASVAVHLLEAGVPVALVTPRVRIDAGVGGAHRRRVLGALATFDGGRLRDRDVAEADVLVEGVPRQRGADVVVGDERRPFGDYREPDRAVTP